MSDQTIATIARNLAEALQDFAYTRKDDDKKRVAALNFDLIRACKEEKTDAESLHR